MTWKESQASLMHALAHVVAQSSEFCLRTQDLLGRGPGGRSPECLGEVATGHGADYLASFKDLVTSNSVCRAACVLGCSPTSTLIHPNLAPWEHQVEDQP